ncbi:salicylate hydroxylase [Exophiala viscosa]|uniref:salicylate hydroxylase n=1 Tax=Exophiala viscosa TaxID=2486360 RepID=UPI002192718A|nr:salicylate hydroxylase [Exophiala viscosa]
MGSLGYQVEDDLDVVNGHKELPKDYKGLSNGINGIHIRGHVEPTPGRGRPNHFYPITGVYPGVLPKTTGQRPPLKIAIIGGGLAGAAAAGTLSRLPDVDVKVYERSDKVREAGALIGVMVSAMRSLSRMLSPASWERLQYLLYRGDDCEGINHRHWRTGEILTNALSPHTPRHMQEGRISRIALHDLLVRDVPDDVINYSSSVLRVEKNEPSGMRIVFEDGRVEEADLVVAADGLYSKIRRKYLPDGTIAYRGRVSYRQNVPMELVQHIKGLPDDTSSWRRNGEVVFLSKLEPGVYSFVTMASESEEYAKTLEWRHSMGKAGIDRLLEHFKDWDPIINEVVKALPNVEAYPLQSSPWMRDLIRDDAVAFVGDAAHPTAGAYGAGCSFAFSDVRALCLSLWRTHQSSSTISEASTAPYDVPYALRLYNETRRHFLARVEEQIKLDKLDTAYVAAAGSDEKEWIRRYRERFTINWWILEHDVDAKWQEVEAMERHKDRSQKAIVEAANTIVGD